MRLAVRCEDGHSAAEKNLGRCSLTYPGSVAGLHVSEEDLESDIKFVAHAVFDAELISICVHEEGQHTCCIGRKLTVLQYNHRTECLRVQ